MWRLPRARLYGMHGQAHDWCTKANGPARRTRAAAADWRRLPGWYPRCRYRPLDPGCYTSIADSVTTLTAGIYYVTGPVNVNGLLSGTNVMIYLTGAGQITSNNNDTLRLSAPTSGPVHRDCDLSGSKQHLEFRREECLHS